MCSSRLGLMHPKQSITERATPVMSHLLHGSGIAQATQIHSIACMSCILQSSALKLLRASQECADHTSGKRSIEDIMLEHAVHAVLCLANSHGGVTLVFSVSDKCSPYVAQLHS